MKNVFFSIDALMGLNGENIRGILNIDTQRLKFVSNESVLLEKNIIWDKLEYTIKKEKVRKFLLFSSTNYLISFTDNEVSLPCFVIDEKQGEKVCSTINRIRELFIEQENRQKKLERDRLKKAERLEAENQKKLRKNVKR